MKVVINIDENVYTRLFDNGIDTSIEDREIIDTAVRKGTPLPEEHGDLKDADTLWDIYHTNDYDFYEALSDAPTIIPANKAKSEEENADSN